MRSKYRFLIVVLFLINTSGSLAQGYLSRFVPLDFLPNTRHLLYDEGKYIVSSINFIEDISTSTIIELDENFDTIRTIYHANVLFGRKTPQKYNGHYYAYAADETTNRSTHLLLKMDENFNELKRDTFYSDGATHNANGMTIIGDKIVGSAWDYYNCQESFECTYMNYKVITTEGEELQSINVDKEEEPYFFSFEVDYTSDEGIIFGGNRYDSGARATVYKVNQDGSIQWQYNSDKKQSRGNVPVWVEELSDGNIVYADRLDKSNDDDWLDLLLTNRPTELVWLSPDGDYLFSYLDSLNWTSSSEYFGIQKGKGDYFFAFGQYHLGNVEPTEFDGNYGFIMKVKYDGEIMWRRLYSNSEDLESTPIITHLLEHENDDLAIAGVEASSPGYYLWMMRVNEHGCLGGEDCDEPLLLPIKEISDIDLNHLISVFPNPTKNMVTISSQSDNRIKSYTLCNMNGQKKNWQESNQFEHEIDLTNLPSGIYMLQVVLENEQIITRKIIKNL